MRKMALTQELVARVHRSVTDAGPSPGLPQLADEDYEEIADRLLRERNGDDAFWVFAYGSLIWKPEFVPIEERRAMAAGWHRAFAIKITRWRGTPECPGLMLALDRGGSCAGLAYRLDEAGLRSTLDALLRREMTRKPPTNVPRWIRVTSATGSHRALAFTVDRTAPAYAGVVTEDTKVEMLSSAVGHWGSCAEYLLNTVEHLEQRGIHDRYLWRLQALVAAHIRNGIRSAAASPIEQAAMR
jgi:cation transport protein ChaC